MSTRSLIGKANMDGTFSIIYCHHDGYPTYVGKILENHYNSENIDDLLALGDLSVLGTNTDVCEAYHRDRGERLSPAKSYANEEELIKIFHEYGCEYLYILNCAEDTWYYRNFDDTDWNSLIEAVYRPF